MSLIDSTIASTMYPTIELAIKATSLPCARRVRECRLVQLRRRIRRALDEVDAVVLVLADGRERLTTAKTFTASHRPSDAWLLAVVVGHLWCSLLFAFGRTRLPLDWEEPHALPARTRSLM